MNRLQIFGLIISVLTIFSACVPSSSATNLDTVFLPARAGYGIYKDRDAGFTMYYPESWEINKGPKFGCGIADMPVYFTYGEERGMAVIGITKLIFPINSEPLAYFNDYVSPEMQKLTNYKSISTKEITVSGHAAVRHTCTSTSKNGKYRAFNDVGIVFGNQNIWQVSCQRPEDSKQAYSSTFDTVINGFTIME